MPMKLLLRLRGELYLGDIGIPPALYEEPSLELKTSTHLFMNRMSSD